MHSDAVMFDNEHPIVVEHFPARLKGNPSLGLWGAALELFDGSKLIAYRLTIQPCPRSMRFSGAARRVEGRPLQPFEMPLPLSRGL
jgi:hypothetical protein